MIRILLLLTLFVANLTYAVEKPRVFIFTDINLVGGDPDDRQSLIHLLWYANELEIEGIVPDRWDGKGYEACMIGMEAYKKDYERYGFGNKGYPSPGDIQGRIFSTKETAIEQLRIAAADGQLYVLVWGNMGTFRDALFAHPEIARNVRVLSIGTGRKYGPKDEVPGEDCNVSNWNGYGRDEIYNDPRFKDMWWLESNWTYNGMFMGDGPKEMFQTLSEYGSMGLQIKEVTKGHDWAQYFRVGDTPSVTYLLDDNHDIDNPETDSWAGKFRKPFPDERPNYFTDDNGTIEWDYNDPCNTWSNLQEMYAYNKETLFRNRQEMYDALIAKLNSIYK